MKTLITILFVSLFTLGFAQSVQAHATPISYEPEASSVVEKIPARVRIHFSERIEEGASSISVYGPDGSLLNIGEAKNDSFDARIYGISIRDSEEGTHTVSWQVVSADDGHFTKGAFAFSAGKATGTAGASGGQIQIQHITTIPQAVTIGIELVGQALILGVLFFLIFLWRPLKRKLLEKNSSYKEKIEHNFSILFIAGAVLIIIGALSFVILKTFDLQQLRPGDFFTMLKIFLSATDGSYALGRAFLGFLSIPIFFIFRKSIFKSDGVTKGEVALLVFLFLMLLARARVSHAAASHFYPWFSILINALQLLFKELWVGGLVVFSVAIAPFLLRLKNYSLFTFISTLFSKFISIAFAGMGVTGVYIVWLHLKDPAYLLSTEWGTYFIILSIIGGILFAFRIYHQLIVDKMAVTGRNIYRKIFTISLETLVGVALIFVTSLMIITTPPYATEKFTFEKSAISQDAKVTMRVHPFESSKFLIDVTSAKENTKNTEIPVSNMVVTITNEEKNIGPIVINTEQRFVGGYVFPEALLTPAGKWKIDISAQRPDSYDAVASFQVDYPKEIEASRIAPDKRSFGLFEIICLIMTLVIMGLGYLLYNFSKKLHDTAVEITEIKNEEERQISGAIVSSIISFFGLLLICAGVWYSYNTFIKTDFQKLCEKNGHFWLQSIPMKDGQALSPDTVTGCFLDVGLYHFGDKREYEFFFRKREIVPELSYKPTTPIAGAPTDINISLSEIKNGKKAGPVTELGIYHDRILHVLVMGEDLKTYSHIHPENLGPITEQMKKDANFPLKYTFPKAGRYALNIDYVISGIEYTNVVIVNVEGNEESSRMIAPVYNVAASSENIIQIKDFDGYRVTFNASKKIKTGEKVSLSYYIEKENTPVTKLEPYLGAAMHIGIVRNDLGRFFHTHGEASELGSVWFQQLLGKYYKYHMHFAPDQFGPKIITPYWSTKFTTPGSYTVFGEFKDEGKVIVTDFSVQVE